MASKFKKGVRTINEKNTFWFIITKVPHVIRKESETEVAGKIENILQKFGYAFVLLSQCFPKTSALAAVEDGVLG